MWPQQIIWLFWSKKKPFMSPPQCHHHCWQCFILRGFLLALDLSLDSSTVKWITASLWLTLVRISLPPLTLVKWPLCNSITHKTEYIRLIAVMENWGDAAAFDFQCPQKCKAWASMLVCTVTTNNVISRSVRVLMSDDDTDNIWQDAGKSPSPRPNNTSPSISELYFC